MHEKKESGEVSNISNIYLLKGGHNLWKTLNEHYRSLTECFFFVVSHLILTHKNLIQRKLLITDYIITNILCIHSKDVSIDSIYKFISILSNAFIMMIFSLLFNSNLLVLTYLIVSTRLCIIDPHKFPAN